MYDQSAILRIIPCLLISETGLVKTTKFKNPVYIGDAVNAVKIFSEKEADELILLDIDCGPKNRNPRIDIISEIVSEAFMPICYGGGIKDTETINKILFSGVEKVSINSSSHYDPELIKNAATIFGSQAIVVSIDVGINWRGKKTVYIDCGRKNTGLDPVDYALKMQDLGAGELLINCIYKDGIMSGYDIDLMKSISTAVDIPVIALGGAGDKDDMKSLFLESDVSAASAGSMFVFTGIHKAVLINYSNDLTN
jgi:imidazole glycerol-phosphate synthase subunit HisF